MMGRETSQIKDEVKKIVDILKEEGAKKIILFGSSIEPSEDKVSDIDVACEGIEDSRFFSVLGRLMLEIPYRIDLVDLSEPGRFTRMIQEKGVTLYEE